MQKETGKIVQMTEEERNKLADLLEPIDMADATRKQAELMQVSLKDHTSKLGKQLTRARAEAALTKNRKRALRRKGLLR